jgi:DNA-binding response OmpR family regulator
LAADKATILIVDDEPANRDLLEQELGDAGYRTLSAASGEEAIQACEKADLILLDVMMGGIDGYETCRRLKAGESTRAIPVIFLTALSESFEKVRGFGAGAVDYVTKPFDLEELLARVRTVLRRASPRTDRLQLGDVAVDFQSRRALRGADDLRLTDREFEILRYLASHVGRVVYRSELLRAVWGYPDDPLTRSVDHAIARLRKKIERDHHDPQFIQTVHGDGYRLTTAAQPEPSS